MGAAGTRERILDAAEKLFCRAGASRTSLRAVTVAAGVNVAAVHYHFGSREALLEAVFARRVAPVHEEQLRRLDAIEIAAGDGPLPLEPVLEAFLAPALRLRATGPSLARLIGRLWAEPEEEVVVEALHEQLAEVARRFVTALGRALPGLPPLQVAWRFRFMVATLAHVLTGGHHLDAIGSQTVEPAGERETLAFLAAGFRADATTS
jgi:AcrR family transcriptional regulator